MVMDKNLSIFIFLSIFLTKIFAQTVEVNTSRGRVLGFRVDYGNDTNALYYGSADVFLGIPFVQPPVGQLRFQYPQPMLTFPNAGEQLNATVFKPICPQLLSGAPAMSEDCLHLNIFSPDVKSISKYPVMVWIHGGAMKQGHAQQFPTKGIVRNLVSRGVVVVTMQYRLGTLGFFTTFTDDFPANLGMLDQVEALKWVNDEIANFAGNPSQITIFGQSAGGASVSAHTLSPCSQGLFQQAIMESGSVLTCFEGSLGFSGLSKRRAFQLCNVTGSQWDNGQLGNLKSCLQNMDYRNFLPLEADNLIGWKMSQDKMFMPEVPRKLQLTRPNIPVIIGSVRDEWAAYDLGMIHDGATNFTTYTRQWVEMFFKLHSEFLAGRQDDVWKIMQAVFGELLQDNDNLGWLQANAKIYTAAGFTGFLARDALWYLKNQNPNLFMYEYVYPSRVGERYTVPGWRPVGHAAEIPLIFMQEDAWNAAIAANGMVADDLVVANQFGKMWTDFAKFGTPAQFWYPTVTNEMAYLEISPLPKMKMPYRPTDRIIWNQVVPSLIGDFPPEMNNQSRQTTPAEFYDQLTVLHSRLQLLNTEPLFSYA